MNRIALYDCSTTTQSNKKDKNSAQKISSSYKYIVIQEIVYCTCKICTFQANYVYSQYLK